MTTFDNFIIEASQDYNVDPDLIRAIIDIESSSKTEAVSEKSAGGLMQLMPACMTTDTQCLTELGWKSYDNLVVGDKIFTYNICSKCMEIQPINEIYIYENPGSLLRMHNTGFDFVVTPNHKWVVFNPLLKDKREKLQKTIDIAKPSQNRIVKVAEYKWPINTTIDDSLVYVMGIVFSDGSIGKKGNQVDLYQKNLVNRFDNALKNANLKYKRYDNRTGGCTRFCITGPSARRISTLLYRDGEKRLPLDTILQLTQKQTTALKEALFDTDASDKKNGTKSYCQSDKDRAEDLQNFFFLCGMDSVLRIVRKPGIMTINGKTYNTSTKYQGHIKKRRVVLAATSRLNYTPTKTEPVWCPSVENKTWIAKRKGIITITGNTAKEMGVKDLFDPRQNIMGGTKYLRQQLDMFNNDETLALAAYNAGPTAVEKHNGIPPFPETQNYVQKVMDRYNKHKTHPVKNQQEDLGKVMKALRAADAANATEDAKQLAVIARKLAATEKTRKPQTSEGGMGFVNRGIATTLGAPVDTITAILNAAGADIGEPVGGKKSISSGFKKLGISVAERKPQTTSEYIGAGIGEVAGALPLLGGSVNLLAKKSGLVGDISRTIMGSIAKNPILSTVSEVGGGVGVGLGRKIGEEHPETKPYAEMVGGVIGGASPGMIAYAPGRIAYKGSKNLVEKATLPFSEQGSKYRASKFLRGEVADPEKAIKGLKKETIGKIPPALLTGEKKLIALYRDLSSKDPIKDVEAINKITKEMIGLANDLKGTWGGSPAILKDVLERRVSALDMAMNNRILNSMTKAQNKLDALPVAERKSKESIIVRDSLENIMETERENVQKIWDLVSKNIDVKPTNTKLIYENLKNESSQAQMGDFPIILKKSFILKKKTKIPITVNEMQGLRSKLLEVGRNASAITNPKRNLNTARICREISDVILEDIEKSAGDDVTLKNALKATYNFKDRFEKGIVGKILGADRTNAPCIEPEVVLDIAIARNPQQAAVNIDKITITPKVEEATQRYIARSFTDYALDSKTGTLVPSKATKWIKNNEAILDRFPKLKEQILDASKSQKLALNTKALMEARKVKLRDPRISVASNFLKTDIDKEIPSILKSKNPVFAAEQLIGMASKDVTGKSLPGLRAGFADYILEQSYVGGYNEMGERILSGSVMRNFLNKNKNVLEQVFSKEQLFRMNRIADELSTLETYWDKSIKSSKLEAKDGVSSFLSLFGRVGGAQVGRKVADWTGGGTVQTPGIFSERVKMFMGSLTKDRTKEVLSDAILSDDSGMLEFLLKPIEKPKVPLEDLKLINQRLNAWLLGSGNRVLQDIQETK